MRLKETDLVKLDEKTKNIFLSFKKRNLILKKNLNISLINIRRPPILIKCAYSLRSIIV